MSTLGADGCGTLNYGSGRILAMVNRVNGGKYYYFYDDTKDGTVLASFNFCGIGFVNYRSSKPRFVTTKHGGSLLDENGLTERTWSWEVKGVEAKLNPPIRFSINPTLHLCCTSRSSIEITSKSSTNTVFQVGKHVAREDSYLEKIKEKRVDGSLVLNINAPTLIERQEDFGKQPALEAVKLAQRMNWNLPRVSASGRETDSVQVGSHLENLVAENRSLVLNLKEYRTTIGRNIRQQEELLRQTWKEKVKLQQTIHLDKVKSSVPSSKTKAYKRGNQKLHHIKPRQLDKLVRDLRSDQLLVVLCSTLSTTECIKAEKMLCLIEDAWYEEDLSSSNSATPTLPEDVERSRRIILADCSSSSLLGKRHNFTVYPMYIMYYGRRLAYCSNTLNGFGVTAEDFKEQVKTTIRKCNHGTFLPDDFRF